MNSQSNLRERPILHPNPIINYERWQLVDEYEARRNDPNYREFSLVGKEPERFVKVLSLIEAKIKYPRKP